MGTSARRRSLAADRICKGKYKVPHIVKQRRKESPQRIPSPSGYITAEAKGGGRSKSRSPSTVRRRCKSKSRSKSKFRSRNRNYQNHPLQMTHRPHLGNRVGNARSRVLA
ncbi:hypothetical protein HPB50_014373 [Hyalomma asiaticum]|uniref:Uncharacterized protein n=1 Tax=Hyalomma asiaticum TaxID=266040 RepID=A0ACB7S798_HYAAI|nr:hypothetical protein HPB50_014373 [Hyalomma asiaticum]